MAGRKRTNISQSPRQWGGLFFDEVGPAASDLATLCRDPKTTRLLHDRGVAFVEAIEASGMEPPDTPLLEWGDLTIDESLERDAVAEMLEQAIDDGQLAPEAPGWRQRQAELVEGYLLAADKSETTPLARIYAARRQAWLELSGDGEERALLFTLRAGKRGSSYPVTVKSARFWRPLRRRSKPYRPSPMRKRRSSLCCGSSVASPTA